MNAIMKKKGIIIISVAAAILSVLIIWTVWGNLTPELNSYTVTSDKLPEAFDRFRIAHVSDLHNTELGKDNKKLLEMLRNAQPDIIAITGDLIDSRNTDVDVALHFVQEAVKIAPCFYVTGNHEARISEFAEFKTELENSGVTVLEDERFEIGQSGETFVLLGVDDPSFQTDYLFGDSETVMQSKLTKLIKADDSYTVLLSHRPELFETYVNSGVNLVLSGHAHGGQFRLPFIGGIIAPNQGFFPEYDAGLYTSNSTCMAVSRGIGNSLFPFRLNNRPEIILIELEADR